MMFRASHTSVLLDAHTHSTSSMEGTCGLYDINNYNDLFYWRQTLAAAYCKLQFSFSLSLLGKSIGRPKIILPVFYSTQSPSYLCLFESDSMAARGAEPLQQPGQEQGAELKACFNAL